MQYQLDLTTYLCPLPLLMAKNALSKLEKHDRIEILLNPAGTLRDFELLCEKEGYRFISVEPCDNAVKIIIEK
ncbi:sulfurtransferase TusA family protein [Pasteurellaceae bacterium LIM206]|nr:sulfurtransferase TusA family protein [Pasteurellaceae bacterium LIM206]